MKETYNAFELLVTNAMIEHSLWSSIGKMMSWGYKLKYSSATSYE